MKINKLFILPALLVAMSVCGQPAFDRLEANNDITTVVVSQKMFQMLSKIDSKDADAKEFMDIANKLKSMKVFSTDNAKATSVMKTEVQQNVKFYTKGGKDANKVSELLMVVEPSANTTQMVILSLTGDIDLSKLGVLTKNMNLPQEIKDIK